MPIRILIADDQPLIREGIHIILDAEPDLEVVAAAADGQEAVDLTLKLRPDLVLMDIQMPVLTGIEALKRIKDHSPETIVLMLTTFDPDDYIYGAFQNGADGYLLKDLNGDRLISLVRDAAAGNILIPAQIAARLIAQIPRDNQKTTLEAYNLTPRETDIAILLSKGYHNEKIANTLDISMGTVKNYISGLYDKLEVKNRKEAVCLIKSLQKE